MTQRHIQAELERSLRALALQGAADSGPWSAMEAAATLDQEGPAQVECGARIDRFVVLHVIGTGGQADVYAAYDDRLDRKVALKLIRLGPEHRSAVQNARLIREARALAQLEHPNVVRVHDTGIFEGAAYLVMEIKPRDSLRKWLETPRRWPEIVDKFLAAGRGLHAAHLKGIVHRDFKADNVFVDEHVGAVLADFGLAYAADEPPSDSGVTRPESGARPPSTPSEPLTEEGHVPGTPGYIAPEAARGRATARSDQYSFCVALYHALFGVMPKERADGWPTRPGDNPPRSLIRALRRGLSVDPAARFPDVEALLVALSARPRGPMLAAVAGVALVTGALWAWDAWAADPCVVEGQERAAQVWNEPRRALLQESVAAVPLPFAGQASESLRRFADGYAKAWVEAHTSMCAAPDESKKTCLSRQLDRFSGVLALYAAADVAKVARLLDVLGVLDEPAECERPHAPLQADIPDSLRADLDRLELEIAAGEFAKARTHLGVVEASSKAHPDASARALFLAGWLGTAAEPDRQAIDRLQMAAFQARRSRDPDTFARASTLLLKSLVNDLGDYDHAGRIAPWIEVAAESLLPEDSLLHARFSAEFVDAEAIRRHAEGDYAGAIEKHMQALTLRRKLVGDTHPLTAKSHHGLGMSLSSASEALHGREREERFADARDHYLDALEIRAAQLGEAHPQTAETVFGLAHAECEHLAPLVEKDPRVLDDCTAELARALEVYRAHDWDPRGLLRRNVTYANYALDAGCLACAEQALREAIGGLADLTDVDPRERADVFAVRGKLEFVREDFAAAAAAFLAAVRHYEGLGRRTDHYFEVLANAAAALEQDGRFEAAVELLLARRAGLATASCRERVEYAEVLERFVDELGEDAPLYARAAELRAAAAAARVGCP